MGKKRIDYSSFGGVLTLDGEQCPFIFNNFVLTIELQSKNHFADFKQNKLNFDSIYGKISNEPKMVFFHFGNCYYGSSVSFSEFLSFNITITVDYYVVLDKTMPNNNISLSFENNSFQKWLDVYPVYKSDQPFELANKIEVKRDSINKKSDFVYKKKRYSIGPSYSINQSQTHFDFTSFLNIECFDFTDFDEIYDLCKAVLTFVKYSFYRSRVNLGVIKIKHKVSLEEGKFFSEPIGLFFFNYNKVDIETIDLDSFADFGFIPWSSLYKHFQNLISFIEAGIIYLHHIPENKSDRFFVDLSDVSLLSAAFEFEFKYCFSEFLSAKINDENYLSLEQMLRKLKTNPKQKEILDNIFGIYFKTPSLSERAEHALKHFESVIDEVFPNKNVSLKDSVQVFKRTRNSIDHGDPTFEITNEVATVFYFIRIVVLCMQLTRLGFEHENLSSIIKPVLSLDCNKQ